GGGAYDPTIQIWNATTGEFLTRHKQSSAVTAVAWSPDGTRVASGTDNGTIEVWDAATGKTVQTYLPRLHASYQETWMMIDLAWSPDGRHIASAGQDVQVWDVATGEREFAFDPQRYGVRAVAWSPDGTHIATGSSDPMCLQIWDASTGTLLQTYADS